METQEVKANRDQSFEDVIRNYSPDQLIGALQRNTHLANFHDTARTIGIELVRRQKELEAVQAALKEAQNKSGQN